MNNSITQKVAYLESLEVEIHDYDENDSDTSGVYFSTTKGSYEVLFKDFKIDDSIKDICKSGTEYSLCCGTLIDTDYRVCLSCNNRA